MICDSEFVTMHNSADCFGLMHNQLHSYMKKGLFTDVTLVVGNEELKAHKAILASSSTVFQTMFETSMEEARSNVVIITDVDAQIFSAFLDYIYIRDKKSVEKHTHQMLMLADKYDIEPLSILCDVLIEGSLTPDNAVDALLVADLYRRCDLKKKIIRFIRKNLDAIPHDSWVKLESQIDIMKGMVHSFTEVENDSAVVSRSSNEVTWILNNLEEWYGLSQVMPPVQLTLGGRSSEIVFNVSLTCRSKALAVFVRSENGGLVHATFDITVSLGRSMLLGQTNISEVIHSAVPKKWYIPQNVNVSSFTYPLKLTVRVKRTYPIIFHPNLRNGEERNLRFADAMLIAENTKFPVHKLILARKSNYFSEILDNDRKEYTVDDMSASTVGLLVEYIYSGLNPPPLTLDLPLLRGAKKLQLCDLVVCCVENLQKNVTRENAVEMCITANELGLETLASAALDFLARHPEIVASSEIINQHPKLLLEILMKMPR